MNEEQTRVRTHPVKPMEQRKARTPSNKSRLAARALANAAIERRSALQAGQGAGGHLKEAERLEDAARELMNPPGAPTVLSGEVAFVPDEAGPRKEIIDTLINPDQAAIEASVARTDLLANSNTDIAALALDAATSVKASNSLEKMLAHQAAVLHALAMKTAGRALEMAEELNATKDEIRQGDSIEFARMAQTAGRLSSAFQDALITMQRLRNGSSQTIIIRQVSVEEGGQAVIGNIGPGDGTSTRGRGN